MRIFVTGASGFVGGHATERLVAAGHEVWAMARSDRSAGAVEGFGAKPIRCGLGSVVAADLAGVEAIVHCAARAEEHGRREQFWHANVDGTQQLLDVAREAEVARFIHIGTEAAVFDGGDLVDIDETAPYPREHRFFYSESKAEAERRVLAADCEGFTTLSLRPRMVWGPRDSSILPALKRMATEGWMWIDGGRHQTSTCHVLNLAQAVELALTKGNGGEAYFVADDERQAIHDFITQLMETQGLKLPERSLPGWLMRPLSRVVEGAWRALGSDSVPPVTAFAAHMMSATVTVRTDKAKADLGYRPDVTVAQGMESLRGAAGASARD